MSWLNLIKCTEIIEITVSSDRKLNAVLTDNKETLLVTLCFGSSGVSYSTRQPSNENDLLCGLKKKGYVEDV